MLKQPSGFYFLNKNNIFTLLNLNLNLTNMKNLYLKTLLIVIFVYFTTGISFSQTSFNDYKRASFKTVDIFGRKEDTLRKEFARKGLQWPAKYVYIRSFKYDAQLEVWVKNDFKEQYRLFKTYKVCMQSGTMGPKRFQGDYQVPEGFYYINEFNPNSNYHLSLGLNYPNASDRILSDSLRPGGEIYIHGSCVSVGCIPLTDDQIEELYIIASYAKANGQDFIPVHVFPVKYSVKKSLEYLNTTTKKNQQLQQFALQLREAFDKFEEKKQIPVVLVNKKGQYLFD
jgi:murein L,D-transpeptidase YafK